MAEQSTQSIVVSAPASEVMAVIADFDAYPQWVGAARTVEVLESGDDGRARRVRFVIDATVLTDDYVLDYTWDGDRQVSWTLVRSKIMKRQDGSYTLAEVGGGTEVTYRLTVDMAVPMIGMLKRRAEKVILDTALKELKKRVEG
ncbi:Ribosome association toxin PasT (RatA) of the RatAB toxin-antitoxin module [Geodermatophilus telluris]|uniref:Ribosome association toxin PasT (RatA) of the RatAB toxin-antitoxin module n=1 Tax=Geodermatophilus telluris TaxID=1190417 RepID=A0A1G6SC62_9ACTN|nr:SRPBCC family protein [Geodermatophilus telluris]SDD13786.1 Ribosome association toxin PasT (RatA) of the RatAB toxin-antitoxin module [Geodermatophilus telluris]